MPYIPVDYDPRIDDVPGLTPVDYDPRTDDIPKEPSTIGGEFVKGAKSGWLGANKAVGSVVEYAGNLMGSDTVEGIGKTASDYWGGLMKPEEGAVQNMTDIGGAEDFAKWAAWNVGQMGSQVAVTAPFMAAGTIGKAVPTGFEAVKALVTKSPGAAGKFGEFLGQWAKLKPMDIPIGILEAGQIAEGQLEDLKSGKTKELSPVRGLAAAFVATKLEELGAEGALNRLMHGVGGHNGKILRRIGKGALSTGVGEGTEEFFQAYAEQVGIDPSDIASKEQFVSAVNGAGAGFIGGFFLGGAGGAVHKAKDEQVETQAGAPEPPPTGAPPPGPTPGASAPPEITGRLAPEFFRDVKKALATGRDNDGQPFSQDDARGILEAYKQQPNADPISIRAFETILGTQKLEPVKQETDVPEAIGKPLEDLPAATATPTPGPTPAAIRPEDRLAGFKTFLESDPDMESISAMKGDVIATHPGLADDLNKAIIEHQGSKLERGGQANVEVQAEAPVGLTDRPATPSGAGDNNAPGKLQAHHGGSLPEPGTKTFVENKIRQLGSIEAVNKFYAGKDLVSDYARTVAPKVLGEEKALTQKDLNQQVVDYYGTGGISSESRKAGFMPAFRDNETGRIYDSLQEDGSPSGVHLLDGLPDEVILKRNEYGEPTEAKGSIEPGFVRDGKFYTRDEAVSAQKPAPAAPPLAEQTPGAGVEPSGKIGAPGGNLGAPTPMERQDAQGVETTAGGKEIAAKGGIEKVIPYSERPPEEKKAINEYNKKMDSEEWVKAYEDDTDMQHFTKEEGHSPLADELIRDLKRDGLEKGAKIAEIGSGQGRDAVYLASKGHEVRGLDVSRKAVEIAEKKAEGLNASFTTGDAKKLPFEDSSQDAVYSIAALHGSLIDETFPEIYRVLKPGGQAKLFLYTKTRTGSKWVHYWTPDQIKKYAKESGFKIEKFREGQRSDTIEIPGVEGKVEQENHLAITTLRKSKVQGKIEPADAGVVESELAMESGRTAKAESIQTKRLQDIENVFKKVASDFSSATEEWTSIRDISASLSNKSITLKQALFEAGVKTRTQLDAKYASARKRYEQLKLDHTNLGALYRSERDGSAPPETVSKVLADYPDLQTGKVSSPPKIVAPAPIMSETQETQAGQGVAAVKEPWEMTSGEFLIAHGYKGQKATSTGMKYRGNWSHQKMSNTRKWHRSIIEAAVSEGKPVPPEVLADYPDLQPKPRKEPPKKPLRQSRTKSPMAQVVAEIKKNGRLQMGAKQTPTRAAYGFLADYSKQDAKILNKMYPTLLSSRGTQKLNDIAEGFGYNDGDELFQALMYPDRPVLRKGAEPEQSELDRLAAQHAEEALEAERENEQVRAELAAEGIDAGRIEASRESVVADLEEEAGAEGTLHPEAEAELNDFFDEIAAKNQAPAEEKPAGPTPQSFKGKNETADLTGMSAAETFSLSNPETEISRGLKTHEKGQVTAGMFEEAKKPEAAAANTEDTGKLEDFGEKIGGARKDTAESGFTKAPKAKREEEGPAWRQRYKAAESVRTPGQWSIIDTKSKFGGGIRQKFPSREAAEEAIPVIAVAHQHTEYQNSDGTYSIYKKTGERKRLKVVNRDFASREDALKYMATHAEEILSIKTSFGEEILPVPEIAIRKGVERRTKDATPEMFMETFAPRGIEFGNWNNQEERQQVMNHAYDGLLDLSDVLGVTPKALMLNGDLAIAFGARGQGLSGAKAHYEPDYGVINLTKMKGAGSLGHEWMHAFDHYLARLDTKSSSAKKANDRGDMVYDRSSNRDDFQSHGYSRNSQLRQELRDAYKTLMDSMYKKAEQYVEDTQKAEKFIGRAKENLRDELNRIRADLLHDSTQYHKSKGGYSSKPIKYLEPASAENLAEFDRLADILVEGGDLETKYKANEKIKGGWGGRYTNDTLEGLNAVMKAARNHQGFNKEKTGSLDRVMAAMGTYKARLQMFEDAKAGTEKTKNVPTSYAIEAKKMDQARAGDYWGEPHEMVARAFAAYVEDKVAEAGGQSDFLVYHAHGGILLPMIDGFVARPYPEGAEREAINKLFDTFIKEIQTRPTPKGVEMYTAAWHGSPHTFDKFRTSAIGTGEGAQAYGYGLYFAGKKEVAEYYKEKLAGANKEFVYGVEETRKILLERIETRLKEIVNEQRENRWGSTSAENELRFWWSQVGQVRTEKQLNQIVFSSIKSQGVKVDDLFTNTPGRLYEVELAPEEDEYLLWDKPLSEQSEKVKAALADNPEFAEGKISPAHRGRDLYQFLANKLGSDREFTGGWTGRTPSDKAASDYLHSLGIRGVKYLDGSSRGKGEGNYNYTIFSEDDVAIKEMYAAAKGLSARTADWSLADVREIFKGQEVVQANPNAPIYIKTRSGQYLTIETVDYISPNEVDFQYAYGRNIDEENERIAGSYGNGVVRLVRGTAGRWTLYHESGHALEDMGLLSSSDIAILRGHIKGLVRDGKRETANPKDIGGSEDRANFLADALTAEKPQKGLVGRVIARIREFLDRMMEAFGAKERTADSVVRDVRSGRIFNRPLTEGADSGTNYTVTPKEGTAKITAEGKPQAEAGPKIGSKLSDEYVYHNTKSEYLEDIKKDGFDQGAFSSRPIDYGGDVWIAVKKSDLPNVQTHTVGKETWHEPGFNGSSISADKIILVDKKGKVTGTLVPETTPKAVGGIKIYRAANDDFVSQGISFAEELDSARAYTDNPNFGGGKLYESTIPSDHKILDLTEGENPWKDLADRVGREITPDMGGDKISQLIQLNPGIMDDIANAGYDWIKYVDDFPQNSITYTALSDRAGDIDLNLLPNPSRPPEGGGRVQYSIDKILSNREGYKKATAGETIGTIKDEIQKGADLLLQEAVFQLSPDIHRMGFLKKFLTSPEWYEHPVLSRIVRLFVRDRNEIFTQLYNHLNSLEQPMMEENTVGELALKLKHKGLNWKQKMTGQPSKEYQDVMKIIDEADIFKVDYNEGNLRKQGYSSDTITVWKAFRESYDKALDVMTEQMRKMIERIEEEAAFADKKPADFSEMYLTLKGALAQMGELRGSYAPRIRQGNWAVTAFRGEGEDAEQYREHRFSHMAANRLAGKLREEGWTIRSVAEVDKLPEDVYQDLKTISVAKAIEKAIEDMTKGKGADIQNQAVKFNEEILKQVADMIRARGFRSSMISRKPGSNVIKGYIEDPLERHALYSNNVARGIAKAKVAAAAMQEMSGTTIKGRRFGGIDPKTEPEIYTAARDYIEEQLRNLDKTDRVIGWAKSLATLKFLGFSGRAAIVNMTSMGTSAPAAIHGLLDGKVSFTKIAREMGRAAKDVIPYLVSGREFSDKDERQFMADVKKKGWDDPQYTRDMEGMAKSVQNRTWTGFMNLSMKMFEATEKFNRMATMLSAYRLARKTGMNFEEASELAKTSSDKAHGVYGRATLPAIAWGRNPGAKMAQMFYVYLKYPHSYLQLLHDLGFRKHDYKAFAYALISPMIIGGLTAWPFKDQWMWLFGMLATLLGLKEPQEDLEKKIWDITRKELGPNAEIAGRYGILGALGVDVSGSLSIGAGLPRDRYEMFGALGGAAKEVMSAGDDLIKGSPWRAAEHILPSGFANVSRAVREAREGVTTGRKNPVYDEHGRPLQPTAGETALRMGGFRSSRQAALQSRMYESKQQAQEFEERKKSIKEQYRAYLVQPDNRKDREDYRDIVKAVREVNQSIRNAHLKGQVAEISMQSWGEEIRKMKGATKKERAFMR